MSKHIVPTSSNCANRPSCLIDNVGAGNDQSSCDVHHKSNDETTQPVSHTFRDGHTSTADGIDSEPYEMSSKARKIIAVKGVVCCQITLLLIRLVPLMMVIKQCTIYK